ncbi:MAG: SRPBCC family protein [Gammaproteobacteria bacterium]|nr:SRPBCC family protein [Gammaproteobacteria bacterium]
MSGHTIELHRVLKAPPERVYRALTNADALVKWMAPNGFTAQVHNLDVKPGGEYKMSFINFANGQKHSFGGTYHKIVVNEYLEYSDQFDDPHLPGSIKVKIELKEVMCGTELRIIQTGVPEVIPAEMCYLGWQESLILMAKLVETAPPSE